MDEKLARSGEHAEMIRALVDWLLLIPASIILIVVETYQPIVSAALVLIAIFFILSGIQGRLIRRRTGLEIPLFLFVVSAGLAVYISYNQSLALLQLARLFAAVALYFAIAESIDPFPELVAVGFLTLAAGLAIFWSLKHDFTLEPGKLELITGTGQWINTHFPAPPGPVIHKNAAGATLLLAVPFGLALTWQAWILQAISLCSCVPCPVFHCPAWTPDDQQCWLLGWPFYDDLRRRAFSHPEALVPSENSKNIILVCNSADLDRIALGVAGNNRISKSGRHDSRFCWLARLADQLLARWVEPYQRLWFYGQRSANLLDGSSRLCPHDK